MADDNVAATVTVTVGDGGKDVGVLVGWPVGVIVATAVVAVAADTAIVGVATVSASGAQAASDSKRKQQTPITRFSTGHLSLYRLPKKVKGNREL
jgi:hypothetical protein